jgi:hypothetical protein
MNPPVMNDPMMPAMNDPAPALGDRTFELSEGAVFGVSSPLRVTIGPISGTPAQGMFTIISLANSDEANGTFSAEPCAFTVATSSFPQNARLLAGARVELQCAVDVNAGTVRLTDPTTNMISEGTLCTVADEEVTCGGE